MGVTSIAPELFAKVWADLGQQDPGRIGRAYSFRRTAGSAGLSLKTAALKPLAKGEAVWTVSGDHADLAATFELTGVREDLCLVELTVPPEVILAKVRGEAVHHWSRHDARMQIWLQQPSKQVTLELRGWVPLAQKASALKPGIFSLPPLAPASADLGAFQIKVIPSRAVSLTGDRLRNLTKRSDDVFATAAPAYEGTFQVRQLPVPANIRISP